MIRGKNIADSLILIVLDSPVPYLERETSPGSLLTLPVGDGSLLDYVAGELFAAGHEPRRMVITPTFAPPPNYSECIRACTDRSLEILPVDQVGEVLTTHEASDEVLLVDPRHWPVIDGGLAGFRRTLGEYRGITHLVAVGADPEAAEEWLERDADGSVRAVQRCYNSVTWPQTAHRRLCMSLLAARVIGPAPSFTDLAGLRALLAGRGVLSRDLAFPWNVFDLSEPHGLLAINERVLDHRLPGVRRPDYTSPRAGLWIGPESQVHASARLVPPVVVQGSAVVEQDAVVIGPTVIGTHGRIGRRAHVAHSIIMPRAQVPPEAGVRECVFPTPLEPARHSDAPPPEPARSPMPDISARESRMLELDEAMPDRESPQRRFYETVTRALNLVLSGIGLLLCAPLGIIVAVLIKLDDPGPILFGHVREGRGGKPFRCWKFRTMVADAHKRQRELYQQNEVDGPQFKLRNDPRVTRVGRWLRSTNLDELPQLLNIVLGDMNLVGPRPSPFRENQICVPWRRARLSVPPGITGLWQLCRDNRGSGDFHQWIFFDMAYVRHVSLGLDLKILIATFLTLGGRWNVSLHTLIPAAEGRRAARRPEKDTGAAVQPAALALALAALGLGGCHDPRIPLSTFLAEQPAVEPAPAETAETAGVPLVDRVIVPYRVGPSDVLTLSLTGADLAAASPVMPVRVDRQGQIHLPLVGAVQVEGMEASDVEAAIQRAYVPAVLKEVAVHIEVSSVELTEVLVVGAVTTPGLAKLRRTERNMLYALVAAGGVTELSSGRATLRRIRRPQEQVTLNLTDPVELEAALALQPLENGDIITVIPAKPNTIFVGGLVTTPRPQAYPTGVEITVLQAIAAAGGLRTDVTPREATLIRRGPDGQDTHVKIDLDRVTTARDPNITLAAGDILWVPDTIETRVQDWVNRNLYIRAGASVNYNVSGIEYLNRASQQSGGSQQGDSLQDSFDPFGFLNRNSALQNLTTRPPTTP